MTCPACAAPARDDARFCEACGRPLTGPSATACHECGGVVDPDGYCGVCGVKALRARDHMVEQPQPWVASVSDRGRRHHRNEDAAAVAAHRPAGSWAVLVVCDGVSTSDDSDVASLAAARAARDVLSRPADPEPTRPQLAGPQLGAGSGPTGGGRDQTASQGGGRTLVAAVEAASAAVAACTATEPGDSPPSCTFVAAVAEAGRVVVGSVGDSRAYWLPDVGEPRTLTTDDSWAAEQVAAGVPRQQAETGPKAHAITRWLGVDAPDHTPRRADLTISTPGWLLLCSDGLWNYCSPATDLADLVRGTAAARAGEPLALASALVDWANTQGGHDNITVALARLGEA